MTIDDQKYTAMLNRSLDDITQCDAENVICYLGGLANWWLKLEVFEKANAMYPKPTLPQGNGACWILLVFQQNGKHTTNSILNPAPVFPLRWDKDKIHDTRLPKGLIILAEMIRSQLNPTEQWGLQHEVNNPPDLSKIDKAMTWGSAWASLYTGLKLAIEGHSPDPKVFASGGWNKDGIANVDGLDDKIRTAKAFHADYVFVPEDQLNTLKGKYKSSSGGELLHTLLIGKSDPNEAVQLYYSTLKAEPDENAMPNELEQYYLEMPFVKNPQDYYLRRIKSEVSKNACIELSKEKYPNSPLNRTLISWVSTGSELIDVAIDVFKPQKVFLFCTINSKFTEQAKRIENHYQNVEIIEMDEKFSFKELRRLTAENFPVPAESENYLIDLTLGTVPMTLSLYDVAPEGSTFLCWTKQMTQGQGGRPIPSTTKPEIWTKNEETNQ